MSYDGYIPGTVTAVWYTVEQREVPENPKDNSLPWNAVAFPERTFRSVPEATVATEDLEMDGVQYRIVAHQLVSAEILRFS